MLRPQSKLTSMSALPRLVVERTSRTPGTARTASSRGRVTSMVIRSAGRSPASTESRTRGKSTWGRSATGSPSVDTTPPATRTTRRKSRLRR